MYCVGADIHDDRDFYGREHLLAGLLEGSERHVFLMGFRRTGKTAVLLAAERRTLAEDRLVPVLIVLQGQRSLDEVRDDLTTALRRRQRSLPDFSLPPLAELRRAPLDLLLHMAQDAAAAMGRGLLLLLDEADTLLRLAAADPSSLLRFRAALPRGPSDRVVLTGARSALQLGDRGQFPGDEPFLAGFARKLLPPVLDPAAARSLIALDKRSGDGAVRLRPDAVAELIRRTGGHPFLLQAACDHLRIHGGDVARAVSAVVALRASTEAFYADLQRLSPSERDVLTLRMGSNPIPPELDVYQRSLVELGVLDSQGSFRVPALAEALRQSGWRAIPPLITDAVAVPGHAAPAPPPVEPQQGIEILGGLRYRRVRRLGSGGMGEVFLIRLMDNTGFQRLAALKVLPDRLANNRDLVARIRDEGRLLGQLQHKAIVRVDFPVEVEGRVGLIMEYVAGLDLSDVIMERDVLGVLPPLALAEVVAEVATALDVAYNRVPEEAPAPLRVLHRDIKPANVRLTRDGEVKVLDFGIARAGPARRVDLEGFGSPNYFAPERHAGTNDLLASDVYALGLVLLELALGRVPSRSTVDRDAHNRAVEAAIARLPPAYAPLGGLARDMLAWDPAERPAAADVAARARGLRLGGQSLLTWASAALPPILELRTLPPEGRPTLALEGPLRSLRDEGGR